jgi:hypothetical protein
MSTDPFEPSNVEQASAESKAHTSAMLGYLSMLLCLLTCCGSLPMLMAAIPVGVLAVYQARAAMAGTDDEKAHQLAKFGMLGGISGALYAILVLAYVFVLVMIYVAMFAGILLTA